MSPDICNKKLLVGLHSLCTGGTERVASSLLEAFSGYEELEIHCLLYGRRPTCFYEVPGSVTLHLPPFEFDAHSRFVSTIKTIRFIRETLLRIGPNVVLNFGERWNNLMLLSAHGTGVPVIPADRSSPARPIGRVHEPLRRYLYRRSAGVIVQTHEAAERMKSIVNEKVPIHVIPNPLFHTPPPTTARREREVLFVGRFIPTKHVDRLIQVFGSVRAEGWQLTIVGDDAQGFSERAKLERMVQCQGLAGIVNFVGIQKDVERFYRRASIFAFLSSSEGFPNVLAEALSFGLPCVAYDCSAGPSDLIQDGRNGFLVSEFDDEDFASRLQQLMGDVDLRQRMGEGAVASVAHLQKEHIARKFLEACNTPINHLFASMDTPR